MEKISEFIIGLITYFLLDIGLVYLGFFLKLDPALTGIGTIVIEIIIMIIMFMTKKSLAFGFLIGFISGFFFNPFELLKLGK